MGRTDPQSEKDYQRAYREAHKEEINAKRRARYAANPEREKHNAAAKRFYDNNRDNPAFRDKRRKIRAANYQKHADERRAYQRNKIHDPKHLARKEVWKAIERGELARPDACERCMRQCAPYGHHPDYTKPLSVIWLCGICHAAAHR